MYIILSVIILHKLYLLLRELDLSYILKRFKFTIFLQSCTNIHTFNLIAKIKNYCKATLITIY